MALSGKTVFLAGSGGMVGTAILQRLLAEPGLRIRAGWRHTPPRVEHPRIEPVQGDLRSGEDCLRMAAGCDLAVMAAAETSGAGVLTAEPWRQVNDNLILNARLLEALFRAGVGRTVFIGSATVYQEAEGALRESDLDWNRDPHPAHFGVGWVMRSLEKLCDFWHRQGMELLIARAANVYGPYARFDPATSNFLPALIRKAVAGMDPFEVWGSPQVTRDLLFAGDLADAVAAMLAAEGIAFDTFNLGSGAPVRVGEAVELALAAAGHRPAQVQWLSHRPVTVKSRVLDCTHARETLGWTPRTPLARGIEITTAWWRENKERWTR